MWDLIVVGGGLAGLSAVFEWGTQGRAMGKKVLIVDGESSVASASRNSTAVVASHGIVSGVSPLGDLLLAAQKSAFEFYEDHQPAGVTRGEQWQVAAKKSEKFDQFTRRFSHLDGPTESKRFLSYKEEALIFRPDIFMNWLRESCQKYARIESDVAIQIQQKQDHVLVHTMKGVFRAKEILLSAGVGERLIDAEIFKGQIREGSFISGTQLPDGLIGELELELGVQLQRPFHLSFEGVNFGIRGIENNWFLGSSNSKLGGVEACDYQGIEACLCKISQLSLKFLELKNKGEPVSGLRHLAPKRMPYIKPIQGGYQIAGLYKNGYSLALHFAQQWASRSQP